MSHPPDSRPQSPTPATLVHATARPRREADRPAPPCLLVLCGASGDLTRRLLMPALYNLACDGLLPAQFAVVGFARDDLSTDVFRERLTADVRRFSTRPQFDAPTWEALAARLYYTAGDFADPTAYQRLAGLLAELDTRHQTQGNRLYYLATPPAVFALIAEHLDRAGLTHRPAGWSRLVVEKPFGHDLSSARALNQALLAHWREDQVFRIDHYLGKETVQNLLAFRFANGIFEPLWNKNHIDHVQFTVSETVGVEGRGRYYDRAGVLRDMIQNHMLQMLAYLGMEPPSSLRPDAVRAEKAKLLDTVRLMTPAEVRCGTVRGQYGPGKKADGSPAAGYRDEPDVDPHSHTETFAALKLFIDNWRWEGVPIYFRSGKSLWQRGTNLVVQFKKAPEILFRDTPTVTGLASNQLIFHIQPGQGIEFRFLAKTPGPSLALQTVDMRFDYREAFQAARGTGYEVLLYHCLTGDATLFSHTDLVEAAWRIAQPILDGWAEAPADDFPNYPAGSWGPRAAFDLLQRDGRRWVEVINHEALARVPLFRDGDPVFLHNLAMTLKPVALSPDELIAHQGEPGREMYVVCRGRVEILNEHGARLAVLGEGDCFGEMSLLQAGPRTASIRALEPCDLFMLDEADFQRFVHDHPRFHADLQETARRRLAAGRAP